MNNIILIGMMGCGKTTVGRLLAEASGRSLMDTDALIEEREARSIPDIFAAEGEAYFRGLELALCRELSCKDGLIIACGGGLPMQEECIRLLKTGGTVIWLDRDPGETYDSLDTADRPLAQQGRDPFLARYRDRTPVYRRWADYVISHAPSAKQAAIAVHAILKQEEEAPL